MTSIRSKDGQPGTTDQSPRWKGPEETRPRGYLPAIDRPDQDRDTAGHNLSDPDRSNLGDAFTTPNDTRDNTDEFPPFSDPAHSSRPASPPTAGEGEPSPQPPVDTQYAGHPDFSQEAAANKPPRGIGNSEAIENRSESEGVNPSRRSKAND